jgi:hypothetical protein
MFKKRGKLMEKFLDKNSEKIVILISWCGFLPLSLFMFFLPVYDFAHALIVHNTILLDYNLFMLQIAGLLAFCMFWLMRKGAKYYREHYCKKPK